MSEIDLGKAVGHQEPDIPVSWNQRDLILYAIGIGAKKDDFPLVNVPQQTTTLAEVPPNGLRFPSSRF
ncbi:hypothetical protein NLI96_g12115 [Meripilus lineatus]|uniref:Uncharacterized protein n=1 Tax=Meripilus lineatus TaxID=2056292 RepID=A0AAD5UQH2_9APHY|nr:hypothetical protein NLI96_g12115 [Physisporinus lineatus]